MSHSAGEILGAYVVERAEPLIECGGDAIVLRHQKSGARVLHIANDDDNTVFCVALRTPPHDDTGVPHILEHSVLCGSKRYPPKKPFVHMLKTSLNTFLNAMTFSDKTIYPVASRNPQDFRNLVSVYLDAVFFPSLTEKTFLQEGWHYHVEDTGAPLALKGVVYNEMRGVYSNPESVMNQHVQTVLLKGTPYEFDSGGNPAAIPQLTYLDFKNFHRRYYHPSNAWTVLYGKLDLAEYLEFMDERVFSKFERAHACSEIAPLPAWDKTVELREFYSLGENDSLEQKTYIGKSWCVGAITDSMTAYGMDILYSVLLGSDASPLRMALLSSGLGQDAYAYYSNDQRDGVLFAGVSGSDADKEMAVLSLIQSTLENILCTGFSPRLVEAVLTRMEFRLREADFGSYPKGLIYAIESYATWLYDENSPLTRLAWEIPFAQVKKAILEERLLEKLLEEKLLKNKHAAHVIFAPEKGLAAKREKTFEKEMEKKKASFSKAEIRSMESDTKELLAYQTAEDSAEDMATLPVLKLSEVEKEALKIPFERRDVQGTEVLFVPSVTAGIGYLQIGFDVSMLSPQDVPWLSLLTSFFTSLGTKQFSFAELSQELSIRTGGTGAGVSAVGVAGRPGEVNPVLGLGTKYLAEKSAAVFDLLTELCCSQNFTDTARVRELLGAEMAAVTGVVQERGSRLAMLRGFGSVSQRGRYAELLEGVPYIRFVKQLFQQGDAGIEKVQKELARVLSTVMTQNALCKVSFSGAESDWASFCGTFKQFVRSLPKGASVCSSQWAELAPRDSGIVIPSDVQYVGLAHIVGKDPRQRGLLDFLGHVLRSGFLWDEVRVKGGAYGCMVSYIPEVSELALVSYRDPNLKRTLDVYGEIPKYLKDFSLTQEKLDELKLGYFGGIDKPLTTYQKNRVVWRESLMGIQHDDVQIARDAVLNATVREIKALAGVFEEFVSEGSVAVVGGSAAIQKEAHLFSLIDEVVL
jgi:Zn-dependent M16 (insulinase) family peptidase